VERLPVRYAAIVCTVVGAMSMSGAGAVAFATPGDGGGDNSSGGTQNNSSGGTQNNSPGGTQNNSPGATQNTGTGSTFGGFRLPKLSGLPGFGNSPFTKYPVGTIAPPAMNLPSPAMNLPPWQVRGPASPVFENLPPPGAAAPGLATAPLAPFTVGAPDPAAQRPALRTSDGTTPPANVQTAGPPKQSPTISLPPLVPPRVPVGQPVTINNPLPDQPPIDPPKPIVPQLLPPPLVAILMAIAERVPLAGLVITPLLYIADRVIPALLSDIVTPTSPLGAVLPAATGPGVASVANQLASSEPAGGSLPPELGVMDMDVPQAPLTPAPPTFEPPHWPSPSDHDVTALSDPVAFRAGYSDYLRNAGMAQITAIAVPGAAAILLFTLGGGFIGYRQARAGHVIRAEGMTRFLR
jgi:hypothetical protein